MSEYEELTSAQSAEAMLRMLLSYHERVTHGNWRYNSFSNALQFGIDCIRKCYPSDFPEPPIPRAFTSD